MQVMDEYEMNMYRKHLNAWEAERLRQQVEFTITEHDLDADKRIPSVAEIVVRGFCSFISPFRLFSKIFSFTLLVYCLSHHQKGSEFAREQRIALHNSNQSLIINLLWSSELCPENCPRWNCMLKG